ncbi:hypothetical protein D3C81_1752240 [compost metagenome]
MRQCQTVRCRFIAVGTAEQVDVAAFECLYRCLSAVEAQHAYRQLQCKADQVCILGGEALIVAAATGDVEGRIVGRRGPQHQFVSAFEPLALRGRKRRLCWHYR